MEAQKILKPPLNASAVFRNDLALAQLFSRHRPGPLWEAVVEKYSQAVVLDGPRLRAEAQAAGVLDQEKEEPADLLLDLKKLDPTKALQLLHHQSPDLDLTDLPAAEPYQVALAVLRMYAPAETA